MPRLAIVALLRCSVGEFCAWFGIKCSSFTSINRGTSARSACSSTGDPSKPSVVEANRMLERWLVRCIIGRGCTFLKFSQYKVRLYRVSI